jgi:hypothetical protein
MYASFLVQQFKNPAARCARGRPRSALHSRTEKVRAAICSMSSTERSRSTSTPTGTSTVTAKAARSAECETLNCRSARPSSATSAGLPLGP